MGNVKWFIKSATASYDTQDRLNYIRILSGLERPQFYSDEIGLPGGVMKSLQSCGIVRRVQGKEKDVLIRVNIHENTYKKVQAHCWELIICPETLRLMLNSYCDEMIGMFSAARIIK